MSVLAAVRDYKESLQIFQESLRTSGFADHPDIVATGVMQDDPMCGPGVLEMALFARVL